MSIARLALFASLLSGLAVGCDSLAPATAPGATTQTTAAFPPETCEALASSLEVTSTRLDGGIPPEALGEILQGMAVQRASITEHCGGSVSQTRLTAIDAALARVKNKQADESKEADARRAAARPKVAKIRVDKDFQELLRADAREREDNRLHCENAENAKAANSRNAALWQKKCDDSHGRLEKLAGARYKLLSERYQIDARDVQALDLMK